MVKGPAGPFFNRGGGGQSRRWGRFSVGRGEVLGLVGKAGPAKPSPASRSCVFVDPPVRLGVGKILFSKGMESGQMSANVDNARLAWATDRNGISRSDDDLEPCCYRIDTQMIEAVPAHEKSAALKAARARANRGPDRVWHPRCQQSCPERLSDAPVLGGMAPTRWPLRLRWLNGPI